MTGNSRRRSARACRRRLNTQSKGGRVALGTEVAEIGSSKQARRVAGPQRTSLREPSSPPRTSGPASRRTFSASMLHGAAVRRGRGRGRGRRGAKRRERGGCAWRDGLLKRPELAGAVAPEVAASGARRGRSLHRGALARGLGGAEEESLPDVPRREH